MGAYRNFWKRVIDLAVSLPLFILMLPIYLLISAVIFIEDGSPILYRPMRGGYKNKPFRIYKFRTMIKNADQIGGGTTALNDSRITKTGSFLRKTKLDETANLINIILGDMSFIGPRPELLRYTQECKDDEKNILDVRPGITDYSSLEFINLDSIVGETNADEVYETKVLKKKNELRIKYAENVSFRTDVSIFLRTIKAVLIKIFNYASGTK